MAVNGVRRKSKREIPSPVEIYRLLPRTSCQKCGQKNCVAFAAKLVNREVSLEACPKLLEKEYEEEHKKLWKMLRPPVKEITIGAGSRTVKIGGEFVMYRHELAYLNSTAIAIDVADELPNNELVNRIKEIEGFSYTYLGQESKLDLIAIRSASNDAARFAGTVEKVVENTDLPLVLCSFNPKVIEAGLKLVPERRTLLYAADKKNWKDMAQLALTHKCPLAVFSPNDLRLLRSMTKTLVRYGVEDLVLDPGTFPYEGLQNTVNNFNMLRWAACREGDELLGFPLIGTPISACVRQKNVPEAGKFEEASVASLLISQYANLLIMHALDGWALLPIIILRRSLYSDPRKPAAVEPGLRMFGEPDENSPVMFTTNFSLTYFSVSSDIESSPTSNKCYLLVIDSEGLGVRSAAARSSARKGGLTADMVAKAIKETGIEQKVKHRTLIIPGLVANLSDEIQKLTGWKVLVGPSVSSELPRFLEEQWYKKTDQSIEKAQTRN